MHAVIARDVREVHMVSEPGGIPAIKEAEADSSSPDAPDAPHVHEACSLAPVQADVALEWVSSILHRA